MYIILNLPACKNCLEAYTHLFPSNKKDRQKELLEEYLEKRAQVKKQQQEMLNEKIAKQEQERSRLLRSWNNERLLSKASNAYEANAMTEAVTDSAFSLG